MFLENFYNKLKACACVSFNRDPSSNHGASHYVPIPVPRLFATACSFGLWILVWSYLCLRSQFHPAFTVCVMNTLRRNLMKGKKVQVNIIAKQWGLFHERFQVCSEIVDINVER
jgi:hypothetical protein